MNTLLTLVENEMTISHREVAENTANNEKSIRNILTKYIDDFQSFGRLHFKNAVEKKLNQGGLKPKTYYLNEQQAYLLLTYLRNSELVRNFKVALIKAFFEMRNKLYQKDSQSFNGKSIHHIELGYKSQLAQRNKTIIQLQDRIQFLASENEKLKLLPLKSSEEKIEVLLKQSDSLLKQSNDRCSFIDVLQNHLKFYMSYVEAIKDSDKLESFKIKAIEEAKEATQRARDNEIKTKEKYNDMINSVKNFIEASNKIAILKPM